MPLTRTMRLGRDAELRYTPNGAAVATLALAYNYGQKDKQTNKRPTQWVEASLWGKRAETLTEYLLKGSTVTVTLDDEHVHTFQKRDGTSGITLRGEVIAIDLVQVAQKQDGAPPQQQTRAAPAQRQAAPAAAPPPADHFEDDDIPF